MAKPGIKEAEPRAMAGNVPVFCSYDEILPLEKIVPNPKNPNKHGVNQISLLAKVIQAQGWRKAITVSTRSGFIVSGHGRLKAAYEAGLDFAPIEYQNYATEAEEYADLIADNRLAELSEIDESQLAGLLREMEGEIDLEMTGYEEAEFEKLLSAFEGEIDNGPQYGDESYEDDEYPEQPQGTATETVSAVTNPQQAEPQFGQEQDFSPVQTTEEQPDHPLIPNNTFHYKEQYGVIVMCKDEADQEKIYNELSSQGYDCKVVAT